MMSSHADWASQSHSKKPSNTSIHSFASSSSTLASFSSSPTSSYFKEHFPAQEHEFHESLLHSNQRPHWRKTPFTPLGLLSLFPQLLALFISPLNPSFLRCNTQPRKLHPTSYLDGLRGVAAFIVFIDHFVVPWFENLKYGYGSSPENHHFLQLPIIRLLYSGRASVGVFFVISGYVLSSKPLSLIQARKSSALGAVLASSTFRRGMRLYLPIVFGTFFSMILAGKGFYLNVPAQTATLPPIFETWGEQVQHWVDCMVELLFPFREVNLQKPFSPDYNGHLWTIPVEFCGSLVVFLVLLGLSGVRTKWRMRIVATFGGWALMWGRWDMFLFLGGMFLAELDVSNSIDAPMALPVASIPSPSFSISRPSLRLLRYFRNLRPTFNIFTLLFSLYLLSFTGDTPPLSYPLFTPNPDLTTLPIDSTTFLPAPEPEPPLPNHGTFYNLLPHLIPSTYDYLWNGPEFFLLSLGSILLIYCISKSKALQRPFNTSVAQYLGDISYSLYIVHGMVVFSLGTHLQRRWTGGTNFGPWVPPVEVGFVGEGDGGMAPVRDVLGWGIPGTYGAGVVYGRGEDAVGMAEMNGRDEVGVEGIDNWRYGKAFFAAAVLNAIVVLWAADLFWRAVDRRCVRFARWVEAWLCGR